MPNELERRVVLLAATADQRELLRRPFAEGLVPHWEAVEADGFDRARFLLHHDTCDAVLLDDRLCQGDRDPGLAWLAAQREAPVILLADLVAETVIAAMEQGVRQWLPRDMALSCPRLLAATLEQSAEWGALRRRVRLAGESLNACRRQVNRMVNLLWQAAPVDARHNWFTQGHMMERLQEECSRSARYGSPFTIAVGEVRRTDEAGGDSASLANWAVEQITATKRRCDVVGQYGPRGSILLLVNTTEPGAERCCGRIREALARDVREGVGTVEAAFGLASCPTQGVDTKSLLSRAERALDRVRP